MNCLLMKELERIMIYLSYTERTFNFYIRFDLMVMIECEIGLYIEIIKYFIGVIYKLY